MFYLRKRGDVMCLMFSRTVENVQWAEIRWLKMYWVPSDASCFMSLLTSLWVELRLPDMSLRVWGEPHSGAGLNILLENGQYPHNSSYEAPCLPWGATREVDDGILVFESWLMSATEYIAIDNTPLRPGVHVDGRSGMARPDQSAGHAKLKSKQPCFV